MPDPTRQFALQVGHRVIYIDFAWPSCRLALEADGAATHATARALIDDLRRQNHIVIQGWVILRVSWEDVHRFPDEVCEMLRDTWLLLNTGSVRRPIAGWR
jgi:very-short-patch-repair endonuclease